MMPDLGAYAVEVSLAYAGSILLLVGIVWLSVVQSRASKTRLKETEARRDG